MGKLEVLSVTIREDNELREKLAKLQLSNLRIRESRALGVTRASQLHPRDLAVWRARIQSQMNELSRKLMRIKVRQATLMLYLSQRKQIFVTHALNLEATVFLKKNSDWNGSARVPYLPQARREDLEPELARNGIPIIYYTI